jgi:hypothetical protein
MRLTGAGRRAGALATIGATTALLLGMTGESTAAPNPAPHSAPHVAAKPSAGWRFSKAYEIPHLRDAVNGLACPTAKECIAVSANEAFWTTDATGGKGHWKHAALEPSNQPTVATGTVIFDDISCPSTHLCVAVDDIGNAFVSTHPTGGKSAWHSVEFAATEVMSVGCSAAGTCAAVDYNGVVYSTSDPSGVWHEGGRATLPHASDLSGVSCAGASLCAVVGASSKIAVTTDPGGSSPAWRLTTAKGGSWDDVACPTVHKCVAVGGLFENGKVAVSTAPGGGHWKHAKLGKGGATQIDCASANSCFVDSDYTTSHAVAKKSAWHPVSIADLGSQTALSCPTTSRCFVGTSTNQFTAGHR